MRIVLKANKKPDNLFDDFREFDLDELILMPTNEWLKNRMDEFDYWESFEKHGMIYPITVSPHTEEWVQERLKRGKTPQHLKANGDVRPGLYVQTGHKRVYWAREKGYTHIEGYYVTEQQDKIKKWQQVTQYVAENFSIEAQELINTVLIEIYPEEALLFEKNQEIKEIYDLIPEMKLSKLKTIIQNQYQWALKYNFKSENADAIFWYRSEEKMEPRLGERNIDKGADKEMLIGIARSIEQCYSTIQNLSPELKINNVAEFIFAHPEYRQIIRRIQTMSKTTYGEIQANLNDKDVLPIHLLRCKLSFFGVGKFDPKSRLWVRNTMFQGAPIVSDINNEYKDEWFFPVMPNIESSKGNEIH